jgi:hypothetical protein
MSHCEASLYSVHEMKSSSSISPRNLKNAYRLRLISRMKFKNCSVNLFMIHIDMTRKAQTVEVIDLGLESGVSISGRGRKFFSTPQRSCHSGAQSIHVECVQRTASGTKPLERVHN